MYLHLWYNIKVRGICEVFMSKVVMPKNSALLEEIEAVLKIYYEENDWLSNDIYK